MARYNCLFTIAVPVNNIQRLLMDLLESCGFEIIYANADYIMGRETPGQVSFSKLVTAEVLLDKTTATDKEIRMNILVKNEELPLQVDNHCRQVFEAVSRAMRENQQWNLIEQVAG
ncbi:MAG: hypothetical protein KME16_09800 [Scytolyngbya sp. HA4215-MV1]|jgi:hypothetical protein|nr:hypothetical protein [Scytolyngbya sp. HA4215-MV1]